MTRKQFILGMIAASFLGATLALGGYALLGEKEKVYVPYEENKPVNLTKYNDDASEIIVPEGLNFVQAASLSTPAVVHIRTIYSGYTKSSRQNSFEDFFRDYFGQGDSQQQGYRPSRGAGSGVIMSADGYIVTNNHVIEDASEIEVLLNDNRTFEAEVVGTDPTTDLALLKVDSRNLPQITFGNSNNLQIGEWVLAVGNPFEFRSTVTAGIVSAKARNLNILRNPDGLQIESFIQTDAAVNPGNSGGALVNLRGELVGINTAIATPTGTFAGYSFAVPATLVRKVVEDLKEFGAVQRALLGIRIGDVSADLAEREGLDVLKGVYISSVGENSAADDAGLESGDVIVAIDGSPVGNVSELQELVALNRPGDEIDVTYIRGGNERVVSATLKNASGNMQMIAANESYEVGGAEFEEVSESLKGRLEIEGGATVKSLGEGRFKEAGIKEGFIVTKIDKRPIRDLDDLTSSLRNLQGDGVLVEGIYPNGDKAYYGLGW